MKQSHFEILRRGDTVDVRMRGETRTAQVLYKTASGARLIDAAGEFTAARGAVHFRPDVLAQADEASRVRHVRRNAALDGVASRFGSDDIAVLRACYIAGLTLAEVVQELDG